MAIVRTPRTVLGPYITRYGNGALLGGEFLPGSTGYMDSDTHLLQRLGERDVGGPWLMEDEKFEYHQIPQITGGTWKGTQLHVVFPAFGPTHQNPPTDASLWGDGATAISRTIPTKPIWSAVTALRELRADGVPSVPGVQSWKKRTEVARNSGGEYLNVQFGWLPLVSDMKKLAKAVNDSDKILQDLRDGSKKTTRVGYHFPQSAAAFDDSRNVLVYHAGLPSNSRSVSAKTFATQTQKKWFNGAFVYHLPESDNMAGQAALHVAEAQKLLGVFPTPEAIYNSSPWTWGLDWFTNTGDIITNITQLGQNGLVLMYGYLMVSCETKHTINILDGNYGSGSSSPMRGGSVTRTRVFKKRIQASPYGFGISDGSLSTQQKAIIAALGLSIRPRR